MPDKPPTHIIIVAAGTGNRFGSNLPKQFHLLDGRPVLMRTIDAFAKRGDIVVVISEAMADYWQMLCREHGFTSPRVIYGGATRFESVRNALQAIDCAPDDTILIHDGARPLVPTAVIDRITEALANNTAVIPVVSVTDSLRIFNPSGASSAVDRSLYCAVQTPQGFRADIIKAAYNRPFRPTFTDDASVAESCGVEVKTVAGDPVNIKITSPRDLAIASILSR